MQPLLPLFSSVEQEFKPIGSGATARCPDNAQSGIACFKPAALKGVLPECYLEGADGEDRVVVPGDRTIVVYTNRSAISAREMAWSMAATRTASLWRTAWRHDLLPRLGKFHHEQRAVVIVNRIGLRSTTSGAESKIWVSSTLPAPIYLAALWRATPRGPEFTLLQKRSTGAVKQVSPQIPVVIDDATVWEWLNYQRVLVPFGPMLKRGQFSVHVANDLPQGVSI
jgi:hypothetical protein